MEFMLTVVTYPVRVLWNLVKGAVVSRQSRALLIYNTTEAPWWMQGFRDACRSRCVQLEGFTPAFWAPDGHTQSFFSVVIVGGRHVQYERDLIEMWDGEMVALDWHIGARKCPDTAPICLVLHSFSGNSDDMKEAVDIALTHGMRPVAPSKRGHAVGLDLMKPRLLGIGDSRDLKHIVVEMRRRYPSSALVALCSSAGAAPVARYVLEHPDDHLLDAAVYISPGYDTMALCCINGGTVPWPYHAALLSGQKGVVEKNITTLRDHVDVDAVRRCTTLNEFTSLVHLKMDNFATLEEYWSVNNPLHGGNVQVGNAMPTLCISARDDPVILESMIPVERFGHDWKVAGLLLTDCGGHCGFLEGWKGEHWDYEVACTFLKYIASLKEPGADDAT